MASAADTISTQPGSPHHAQNATARTRGNPVPLEVPVIATGTRPAEDTGQRDLFTEETQTVLVFRDGAVLRLAAAVALGQLVFLTNKNTKREVVCQVLRKRNFGSSGSYVELDFTEEMADFWGVEFPAVESADSTASETSNEARIVEALVESASAAKTARSLQAASNESVSTEVAAEPRPVVASALPDNRATPAEQVQSAPIQLESLQAINSFAPPAAQVPEKHEQPESTPLTVDGAIPALVSQLLEAAPALATKEPSAKNDPPPEVPKWARVLSDEYANRAPQQEKDETATAPPANPVEVMRQAATRFAPEEAAIAASEQNSSDELLPKPALDFSHAGKVAPPSAARSGKLRRLLLAALLLVVVGGAAAWYENLLPFLPRTKSLGVAGNVPHASPLSKLGGSSAAPRAAASTAGATVQAPAPNSVESGAKNALPVAAANTTTPAVDDVSGGTNESDASTQPAQPPAESGKKMLAKNEAADGAAKTPADASPSTMPETGSSETLSDAGSIVPAKLMKQVNAVYPPDAMRNYITGDVIVDAVVKPDGRVGEMKVLTGPSVLREAATDALKQYEYAPATQSGKAVSSHVRVTVKFWFNP